MKLHIELHSEDDKIISITSIPYEKDLDTQEYIDRIMKPALDHIKCMFDFQAPDPIA